MIHSISDKEERSPDVTIIESQKQKVEENKAGKVKDPMFVGAGAEKQVINTKIRS